MKKIVSIVGARPQFVKAAVLRRAFEAHPNFDEVLIHTGQHYDHKMSEIFFEELSIRPPDHHHSLQHRTHGAMTGEMLGVIEAILMQEQPDACLVYGDTDSTLAGAVAAAKLHIPVIHVEAGLRSWNKAMPEELNRIMTDHVSEILFCSTHESIKNLKAENITEGVFHVGDIMFDAVRAAKALSQDIEVVGGFSLKTSKPIAACTLHRAENTKDAKRLGSLIDYLNRYTDQYDVVLPLHPRTEKAAADFGLSFGDIHIIPPVGYLEMQALLAASELVLTDSGGLQKEAYFHQTPCVTLRDETEWVELVQAGWNRLWTVEDYRPRRPIEEYGDGNSASQMIQILQARL